MKIARDCLLSFCLCLGLACAVSPQPEPVLDVAQVHYTTAELGGEPGAVTPPEGIVEVSGLFEAAPPVELPIGVDGSFPRMPWMEAETRLQVVVDGVRYNPVDLLPGPDGRAIPRPARACIDLPTTVDLGDSFTVGSPGSGVVTVTNVCDEVIEISDVTRLVRGTPDVRLETPGTVTPIPIGESRAIRLVVEPSGTTEFRDRLMVVLDGSAFTESRAVELRGRGN